MFQQQLLLRFKMKTKLLLSHCSRSLDSECFFNHPKAARNFQTFFFIRWLAVYDVFAFEH